MITLTVIPPKDTPVYPGWTQLKDGTHALITGTVNKVLVYCRPKLALSTIVNSIASLFSGNPTNECENLAKHVGLLGETVNPVYGLRLFFVYGNRFIKDEIKRGAPLPMYDDDVLIPIPYDLPSYGLGGDFNIVSPFVALPEILARAVIVAIKNGYYTPSGSSPDEIRKEVISNIPRIIRSNPMFIMPLDEVFRELGLDSKDQEIIFNNTKAYLMKNINTIVNIVRQRKQDKYNPLSF